MADADLTINQALVAAVPLLDQLSELKRERHMRERAFPRFIQNGKLKIMDAQRQLLRLDAAIATIDRLWREEEGRRQPSLSL